MEPLERLINLVALLLDSPRPLTFDGIRDALGAYGQPDAATAKRQFERDKDHLREIGVPVEVVATDVWETEDGYTIPKDRYYLPEISFTPEEVAALFVAAQSRAEDGEATHGLLKLIMGADATLLPSDAPAIGADPSGAHLAALAEASARHRRVRFRYQTAQGDEGDRVVDAWGVVFRKGSWYLVGGDVDRGEPRSYRLSRFRSDVDDTGEGEPPPEDFRAADHIVAGPWGPGEPETRAVVAFSPKVGWWALAGVETGDTRTRDDGWVEATLSASAGDAFVSWVLSFGPDAELVSPETLRDAVVARLEASR